MSTPTIKIAVSQADAVLVQSVTLTSGMTSLPVVKFTFTEEWNGLGKTAVVRAGSVVKDLLVTNNQIIVPYECLETAGVNLIIGVYGTDATVVIPTVWCACGEILDGTDYEEANNVGEATATLVDQMLDYAEDIAETAEILEEYAITGATVDDTAAGNYGTADVQVSLDSPGDERNINFVFSNLKGNGITEIAFSNSGEYKGRINIKTDANHVTGQNFDALVEPLANLETLDNRAQAYAIGTIGEGTSEEPVPSDDPAYHNNSKYWAEQAASSATTASSSAGSAMGYASAASGYKTAAETAQTAAETARGYAEAASYDAGLSRDTAIQKASDASDSATAASGSASNASDSATAASGSATSASNSALAASGSASSASTNALKSEGFAVGQQNGSNVGSDSTYYHNNAKYYKEQADADATSASSSASSASSDASSANTNALKAEGYAVGKQNGTDVGSSSPYYHNNSAYYAEQAGDSASDAADSAASAAESAATFETDTTLSVSGKAADAKATGDALTSQSEKIDELKRSVTHGINLFDKTKVVTNKIMNGSGTPVTLNNGAYSDYIEVEPSTVYYVSRALGSASRPTLVEFNSSKTAINSVIKDTTSAFSFTTNESTKYIVVNTTTPYLDTFIVSVASVAGYSSFKTVVGSGNVKKLNLISASDIFYNNSSLYSKSDILLVTNDNVLNFGKSISVGNGSFLFFNLNTGALTASDTFATGESVYFVEPLKYFEYRNVNTFKNFAKVYCPIEYDAIGKTVKITVDSSSYLFYDGKYYAFNSSQSAELTATSHHFILYFSFADEAFHVTASYNAIMNDCIIIMEAFRGFYQAIAEVKIINSKNEQSQNSFYTFGDSLTWYDGHEFNRGVHEGETCVGFQSYLSYYCGMLQQANYGSSGKTTPEICEILESCVFNPTDSIVFVMGGNNDDREEVSLGTLQPIGGTFDTTTVYGALQHAIETVQATYPKIRFVLMTEPQGWTYETDHLVQVNPLIPEAYRKVAATYSLPLIDLWNESGINELNRDTYYADPPAASNTDYMYHPNNDGWKRISKLICNRVMGL